MATATAPPKTPKTTTSVDPLYAQAIAQAKAALQPQIDTIAGEQTSSDALERQREIDAVGSDGKGGVYGALADALKGVAPATQSLYQNAEQNQELAANGFSAGMQDALKGNADNLNSFLSTIGSPAKIDSHAGEAGDVLYGLGGYVPGETFNREGAAFAAAAEKLPGDALQSGVDQVKQLQIKQDSADADFQNKIAELASKLPGDVQTNYEKLQQMSLQDKKLAAQIANDKFNQTYKLKQLKLQVAKYNTSVDEFNVRSTQSQQRINLEAQKFARQQVQQDRDYQLSLARIGISQKSLQIRAASNEYKLANGGFTQTQVSRFDTKLQAMRNNIQERTGSDGAQHWFIAADKVEAQKGQATHEIGYLDFVKQAIASSIPASLAIKEANKIFPEADRPSPLELAPISGLSQKAAAAASGVPPFRNQGPLVPGSTSVIGHGPQGQTVSVQLPKNVTPMIRKVVMSAMDYLGTPYAWGGESPTGFDCSGLAQYLYAKVGVNIPRTTYDQFKGGLSVPKSQLQAGDLVFFKGSDSRDGLPGHVGIYIGGGKMIQAPHTGDVVKVSSVAGFAGYMGARRYIH
jgi:cell wall-associated NlpC family hydrolase